MLDKGGKEQQKVAGLAEEEGEKGCPKLCVLPKHLDNYIADPALCKVMREGRECQAGHQSPVNANVLKRVWPLLN